MDPAWALVAVVVASATAAVCGSWLRGNLDHDQEARRQDQLADTWLHRIEDLEKERDDWKDAAWETTVRAEEAVMAAPDPPPPPETKPWTTADRDALLKMRCADCGYIHTINCPRVRRLRFRQDGETRLEVEYWDQWPHDDVVSVDDYIEEHEAPSTMGVTVTG
jgi:ribosomal protein L44E